MKPFLSLLLVVLLALQACKPSIPSAVIQPDEMEAILYDYHVAQAMSRENNAAGKSDVRKSEYYLSVLQKHGVTEAEFDSSLVYYYSHVDYLKKIYSGVNERLEEDTKALGGSVSDIRRYSQYSATGDTANIWKGPDAILLLPQPTKNRFDFVVKADTSFYQGDSFLFQFMTEYIWQSGTKDATVCLLSTYEGDSIIQTVNHISVSGTSQIRIPVNRTQRLKQLKGFLYLTDGGDAASVRRMMFISQIQLIRFHDKEADKQLSEADSLKTDSLQRVDNTRGAALDSTRGRAIGRRVGGTPLPPQGRDALHRMDARPAETKPLR